MLFSWGYCYSLSETSSTKRPVVAKKKLVPSSTVSKNFTNYNREFYAGKHNCSTELADEPWFSFLESDSLNSALHGPSTTPRKWKVNNEFANF